MDAMHDRRNSRRIDYKSTVIIDILDTCNPYYGTIYNFSGDGMYCGSDLLQNQNTLIYIRLGNLLFKSGPKKYLGEIRRCEKLKGGYHSHLYGLGIKIIEAIYD